MARMKIEFLAHDRARHGYRLRDRIVGHLPRYAPWASRLQPLMSLLKLVPGAWPLAAWAFAVDSRRPLPEWKGSWLARARDSEGEGRPVALFADTFSNWFEPE